jgi:hypothetical protein
MSFLIASKASDVRIRNGIRLRRSQTITRIILIVLSVSLLPKAALFKAALRRTRILKGYPTLTMLVLLISS